MEGSFWAELAELLSDPTYAVDVVHIFSQFSVGRPMALNAPLPLGYALDHEVELHIPKREEESFPLVTLRYNQQEVSPRRALALLFGTNGETLSDENPHKLIASLYCEVERRVVVLREAARARRDETMLNRVLDFEVHYFGDFSRRLAAINVEPKLFPKPWYKRIAVQILLPFW